jgi:hypothetical protein
LKKADKEKKERKRRDGRAGHQVEGLLFVSLVDEHT